MRNSVSIKTYLKVRKFMEEQEEYFTASALAKKLIIDYHSLLCILRQLQSEKLIVKKNNTYRWKRRK